MEIGRISQYCFRIKHKKTIVLTDPPKDLKKRTAHLVLLSSFSLDDGPENLQKKIAELKEEISLKGEPVFIFGPGEYEIRGLRIFGLREKGKIIYRLKMAGLSLLYLDQLTEKISEEKVELLNGVDILFLSIENSKIASLLISQLEPLLVVPIEKRGVEEFLKQEGVERADKLKKLSVSKKDLPEEKKLIILK